MTERKKTIGIGQDETSFMFLRFAQDRLEISR